MTESLAIIKRKGNKAELIRDKDGLRWVCADKSFHSDIRYAQILADKEAEAEHWGAPHMGNINMRFAEYVAKKTKAEVDWYKENDPELIY
jgi:hypothetical protein